MAGLGGERAGPGGTAPGRLTGPWALARALATLRDIGRDVGPEVFAPYAEAARAIAAREVTSTAGRPTRAEAVEQLVVGSIVFGTALLALRHLAQEHESVRRLADPAPGAPTRRPAA